MATFEVQVEGLTGLDISNDTSPTQDELTEFLRDGVLEITNRCIALNPSEVSDFLRASSEATSNGSLGVGTDIIVSVVRESGTNDDWRGCRKIPLSLQSRAVDVNSLHYASKFNPVYTSDNDGAISVFPAPDTGGADAYKIYYVNEEPRDVSNNANLTYAHSNIKYFPNNKVYLVVLYAGIRSIRNKMSSLHGSNGISTALERVTTAVNQAATAADKFINVDTDSIFGDEATFLTADSQLTRVKDALDNAEKIIDDGANSPTGNAAGDAATYLYTEEDSELVQGALGIATTEIQRAQAHIAEWTSIGDMRVKEIQSALQEAEGYSKEVQVRMADLNQEYTWYASRLQELKQDYELAFERMKPPQQQAMSQQGAR